MLALVGVHVDLVDRSGDEPLQRIGDRPVLTGHREDRPVVAGVARPVEQRDAGRRADGLGEPVHDVKATSLGHVRNRLDQHGLMLLGADGPRAASRTGPAGQAVIL